MAKPTPEQLAKINKFAKEPLSADDVYVHKFRLIGTKFMQNRNLQIDRSLLDRYLPFVENGDVVQIADHSFGGGGGFINVNSLVTLPFGRFFEGNIVHDGQNYQLDGSMYMKAGQKTYVGDFTTDDINQQLDAGILHDNSVSISWGFSECSICHNDIRDYEQCRHWPGKFYDVDGGARREQCFVIAKPAPPPREDNSTMIENSIVCAGAYPDAGVLSAKPSNNEGECGKPLTSLNNIADLKLVNKETPVFCCLSSTSATFQIESGFERSAGELHYLYHEMYSDGELPEGWTMAKLTQAHKDVVKRIFDEGNLHVMTDALDGSLNDSLKAKSKKGSEGSMMTTEEKQAFDKLTADNTQLKTDLTAKDTTIAELTAKVDELTPQAELGKKYREDTIENAIKAGIRDQGNEFDEDAFREMFKELDIEKVKSFAEKWEASAVAKLKGTQHTEGANLDLPNGEKLQDVDPGLYKVGR